MTYQAFKRYILISKLSKLQGNHTEFISCYVSNKRQLTEVLTMLKQEQKQSENIKDKINRKRVLNAIDQCITELTSYNSKPDNGLALFATPTERYSIVPQAPSSLNYYRCDKTFHLTPLFEALTQGERYGLLAIDSNEATLATLNGTVITILEELDSNVSRSVKKGGQSMRRYSFARKEALLTYYNTVAELCNQYWGAQDVTRILYGGILPASQRFLSNTVLYKHVRDKFSQCYPLQYADTLGVKALASYAMEQRSAYHQRLKWSERMIVASNEPLREAPKTVIFTDTQVKRRLEKQAEELLNEIPYSLRDALNYHVLVQGEPGYNYVNSVGGTLLLAAAI